jgi:hypothetical protein
MDRDGLINQVDLDALSGHAFEDVPIPIWTKADLNSDGVVNIFDVSILTDHVKSSYHNIPNDQWLAAVMMPLEQFQGADKSVVYRDSRRKL